MPSSTASGSAATQSASAGSGNRWRNRSAMSFWAGGAGSSFDARRPLSSWKKALAWGRPVSHNREMALSSRSVLRTSCATAIRRSGWRSSTCRKKRMRVAGAAAPSASAPPRARTHVRNCSIHATRCASGAAASAPATSQSMPTVGPLVCAVMRFAGPKPPPPGVSITNTSPGCMSTAHVAPNSSREPSCRSTQLRPSAPGAPPATPNGGTRRWLASMTAVMSSRKRTRRTAPSPPW